MEFELVTPEKRLAHFSAAQMTVPGAEGEFGVLPGHAPFLSLLKPGALVVTDEKGDERIFCVSSGFADVNPDRVRVLAEEAQPKEDIDAESAEKRFADAESTLKAAIKSKEDAAAVDKARKERDRAWAQRLVARM